MSQQDKALNSSQIQKDFDRLSIFTFYMTGIGFLLPYNALFAAMDYFKKNLYIDYNPGFTFVVAVSGPMLLSQVISFLYLERIPLKMKMSFTFGFNGVLTIMMVVLYNAFDYDDPKQVSISYKLMLMLAGIYGCSVALLQLTLYG